jgi:AGZA family xanthine/uracil permease-like MFS transporter
MILSLTGLCAWIQLYAPPCIKKSITVGLGLFQALVGLEQMRLVVKPDEKGVLLGLGDLSDPTIWVALIGIMIITILMVLEVRASMLIGILVTTFTMWIGKFHEGMDFPSEYIRLPDFSTTFFATDFGGFFSHWQDTIPVTLVFLFVSIFDTAGVQYAAGQQAGLLDENHRLPAANQAFFSAGFATSLGAFFGTSPVIIHNETCAGIHDGGRTGLTAVTVGLAFLITLPFAPIFEAVPLEASAPPLVVVGALMMACAKFIDWEQFDEALPVCCYPLCLYRMLRYQCYLSVSCFACI